MLHQERRRWVDYTRLESLINRKRPSKKSMAPRYGTRVVGGVAVLAVIVVGYLVKRHLSGKKDSKSKTRKQEDENLEVLNGEKRDDNASHIIEPSHDKHYPEDVGQGDQPVESQIIHELYIPKTVCYKDEQNEMVNHKRGGIGEGDCRNGIQEELLVSHETPTLNTENRSVELKSREKSPEDDVTQSNPVQTKVSEFVQTVISESVKKIVDDDAVDKDGKSVSTQESVFQNQNSNAISLSQNKVVSASSDKNSVAVNGQRDDDLTLSPMENNVTGSNGNQGNTEMDSLDLTMEYDHGRYTEEEITDALLVSQNSPGLVSAKNAEVLVALLGHPDQNLLLSAVNGIIKCSTFHRNQNLLRDYGCLARLSKLLRIQSMSLKAGAKPSPKFVSSVTTAITNLSLNTENNQQLEACVPTLVDLALEDETGESVRLSSLQALTNLSVTPQHHGHYTRVVQRLYDLLNSSDSSIQMQSLKILVNLSSNLDMVPHLLAAKAPECVYDFLKQGTDEGIILRWTTVLANILQTVKEKNLSSSSLPCDDKAPSPETMYSALLSVNSLSQIKSKVFLLCRHRNQEIQQQATKIHHSITR
ncbi:hypothetical protein KUTeg_020870 [Tegillarca granosa]|uniref:Armadillo repeat-containing domain-containing protein n=1 Tax=Tegillarca granosa TaxID=220873 RepID=A0ABQ9E961_TEGGR|nr:hypothetical protein KUTeg_020870 [Tegillarca granosa]